MAPDLIEALVELDELDDARAVTARLETLSEQQQHPWGLLTARRCGALISLATPPYDEAAADRTKGCRQVLRRTRPALRPSQVAPRPRQEPNGGSRSGPPPGGSLDLAVEAFDQIGSTGWAGRARSELARVGARHPGRDGQLTASEKHVVELAAAGHSNKQIAQALFITVKTVEGHLSRAYAKLGITSRGQLTHSLQGQQSSISPKH